MWMTHRRTDGNPRVCRDRPCLKARHRRHPVVLLVLLAACLAMPGTVAASVDPVGAVGLTVSDLDRSVEFYTEVLTFEKVGETEVSGPEVDRLHGILQRAPPPVSLDGHEQLVQIPGVAHSPASMPQSPSAVEPERLTSLPNRLVAAAAPQHRAQ